MPPGLFEREPPVSSTRASSDLTRSCSWLPSRTSREPKYAVRSKRILPRTALASSSSRRTVRMTVCRVSRSARTTRSQSPSAFVKSSSAFARSSAEGILRARGLLPPSFYRSTRRPIGCSFMVETSTSPRSSCAFSAPCATGLRAFNRGNLSYAMFGATSEGSVHVPWTPTSSGSEESLDLRLVAFEVFAESGTDSTSPRSRRPRLLVLQGPARAERLSWQQPRARDLFVTCVCQRAGRLARVASSWLEETP